MTRQSAILKVLNSLIYIRDSQKKDFPDIDGRGAFWFTPSCVAVSCLPDCDGPTTITVGAASEVAIGEKLLFDGRLETPSHRIVVETVVSEAVLEQHVPTAMTRVRIWTNGYRDTDKVEIGLG